MEADFWHERWRNKQTGFHQQQVNAWLTHYYDDVGPTPDKRTHLRVFVPLCGKSRDMLWLSRKGFDVVGVEINDIAVKDFFSESQLQPKLEQVGDHTHYSAENIRVIHGDYFACEQAEIGPVTDVFDRASLIAMPADMRVRYAQKMSCLLSPGCRVLLVTLGYPQDEMDGPPFSVNDQEVSELFGAAFSIEQLASNNVLDDEPKFRQRGLTSLIETAYKLTKI